MARRIRIKAREFRESPSRSRDRDDPHRGVVCEPRQYLRPGQFGRVRALTSQKKDALLIPQRAVTELQGKSQVAVVGQDNKVTIRQVILGPAIESRYVVNEGLSANERSGGRRPRGSRQWRPRNP